MGFLRFKERFENAMLRGNEKNATEREKRIGSEVAKVITLLLFFFSFSNSTMTSRTPKFCFT